MALWRNRVVVCGLIAIALTVAGEWLMRAGPEGGNPDLGRVLVLIAALLVGPVSWVRDGTFRRSRPDTPADPPSYPQPQPQPQPEDYAGLPPAAGTASPAASLPVRRAGGRSLQPGGVGRAPAHPTRPRPHLAIAAGAPLHTRLRLLAYGYSRWRSSRAGRIGTATGLLVVTALAALLYTLLRQDFNQPLAPWIWLAVLAALVLTFVGVRPWPGGTLITHDPAEPSVEPPVRRTEWLLLALIMVVAVVARVWDLEHIPAGPYIDEADRIMDARHLNAGEPVNREQFVFFGTGWWGVPSLYFWLVAQSLKVFGDTLAGARMMHVIAGLLAVWLTYRIGRLAWSPRTGVLAGALMAVSDFAIQFSRTAGESTITLFTWTACFYFLYRALKYRQPLDFVLSGLAAGFTLYTYGSSKLLPPLMAAVAVYLLARWGLKGVRLYLPGLALLALAAGLTYAPNGLFVLTHKPEAFTERSNGIFIFTRSNADRLMQDYGTDNWPVILTKQFALTYSAFDVGRERGPFYPKDEPVLPLPWAAVWVLGGAYMVWRAGDARYGVLALWLLGGLAGTALTNDTPTIQRLVGMVPTLGLIPALFLDRVAGGFNGNRLWRAIPVFTERAGPAVAIKPLMANLALAGFVGLTAYQCLSYYFGPYTAQAHYIEFTLAGRYIEQLDPGHHMVYQFNLPVWLGDPSPFYFFVHGVTVRDLANAPDELPVTDNQGKDVHFLISPPHDPIVRALQAYYPGGELKILSKPDGTGVVAAYHLTAAQLDARRYATARYGPQVVMKEPRVGTGFTPAEEGQSIGPPLWITYPTTAEWTGGLVAPAYGTYRFGLDSTSGATLWIDGREVLSTRAGGEPVEVRLVLAEGVHSLRLAGTLDSPQSRIDLRWGTASGPLVPIARGFLWDGPPGTLVGASYPNPGMDMGWLTGDQLQTAIAGAQPMVQRLDGLFSWHNISASLHGGPYVFGRWQGKLLAYADGPYLLDADTNGALTIWVDGRIVAGHNVDGVPGLPATVNLQQGAHDFEVRFQSMQDNSVLQLFWQPPGGQRRLLPPDVVLPAYSGVWFEQERPGVPPVDASLLNRPVEQKVRVVRTISGQGVWKEARGVAVLPDGGLVVGDAGNHRLLFYTADGRQTASFGGPDVFNLLSDVAVGPDGTVAALDADNGDIRLFDGNGHLLAHLGHDMVGLTHAQGIAWGPDDRLYVGDTGGSRVARIRRDGVQEASWREGSNGVMLLEQPVDVAVAADGSVYAVDLRRRIVGINAQGLADREWVVDIGINRGGSHLTAWQGRIVMTNPDTHDIIFLDPSTGSLAIARTQQGQPLGLNVPTGITTGPDNLIYVMDSGNDRIVVLEVLNTNAVDAIIAANATFVNTFCNNCVYFFFPGVPPRGIDMPCVAHLQLLLLLLLPRVLRAAVRRERGLVGWHMSRRRRKKLSPPLPWERWCVGCDSSDAGARHSWPCGRA
jgi:4-amino-4-deoxy-L-arabinose transferase-like glycosyltransferase